MAQDSAEAMSVSSLVAFGSATIDLPSSLSS